MVTEVVKCGIGGELHPATVYIRSPSCWRLQTLATATALSPLYSHRTIAPAATAPCSHRSLQSRPAAASAPARCALRVALGVDVSSGDVDRLIGQIDNDGNGVLNFDEFMGICQDKTA